MTATEITDIHIEPDTTGQIRRRQKPGIVLMIIFMASGSLTGVGAGVHPHLGAIGASIVLAIATAYMLYIADTVRPSHKRYRGRLVGSDQALVRSALGLGFSVTAMVSGAVAAIVPDDSNSTVNACATVASYWLLLVLLGLVALQIFKRQPKNAAD